MSELQQAINEMRNMRESYDQLAGAAEAYNTGKPKLAANITSKGVQASATETLPELAEKVAAISQETYEINGGEMYAKQLFGSLETPNYWNLYDVLAQLLSDGRLVQYGGILLAEYYRGYDSLALAGAGAGGAYVVSDKDENGQFKMYTEDTTHVWDTEFDGKGNRWVAYCFADEYHDFQITDTNTSPRSIFIGRKVGTITNLVNGRVSQIVVPDGNELTKFVSTYAQNFAPITTFRNISLADSVMITGGSVVASLFLGVKKIDYAPSSLVYIINQNIANAIIEADEIKVTGEDKGVVSANSLRSLIIKCEKITLGDRSSVARADYTSPLKELVILGLEELPFAYVVYANNGSASLVANLKRYYIGYKDGVNDKTRSVNIAASQYVTDVELQDGWNKPFRIGYANNLTEENMYAHILQKLKQDEPDCGDGVTITLGQTNLDKLTSEESIALLDELTNTYGYTFA